MSATDRTMTHDQQRIRLRLEAGACPFCERAGFHAVALHVNLAHGISRHELKEMAGVIKGYSFASPELSEKLSEKQKTRWESDPEFGERFLGSYARLKRRPRRQVSSAGDRNMKQARAAGLAEKAKAVAAERIGRFLQLGGDWDALARLADDLGQSKKTTRAYLSRHGIEIDGRTRERTVREECAKGHAISEVGQLDNGKCRACHDEWRSQPATCSQCGKTKTRQSMRNGKCRTSCARADR